MIQNHVLVVEDEEVMQEFYENFFEIVHSEEFQWTLATNGKRALEILRHPSAKLVDVVVLDWGLPGITGLEVLRHIKSDPATRSLPVFMVTGKVKVEERVLGLETGVDDYLIKPFHTDELYARLRSILRRKEFVLESREVFEIQDLKLDAVNKKLMISQQEIHLEPKEFELLNIFLRRPDMIHSSSYLWDSIWGYKSATHSHVIEAKISSLRKKLGSECGECLKNHKNQGYSFEIKSLAIKD